MILMKLSQERNHILKLWNNFYYAVNEKCCLNRHLFVLWVAPEVDIMSETITSTIYSEFQSEMYGFLAVE
jgi:hypothetical protein